MAPLVHSVRVSNSSTDATVCAGVVEGTNWTKPSGEETATSDATLMPGGPLVLAAFEALADGSTNTNTTGTNTTSSTSTGISFLDLLVEAFTAKLVAANMTVPAGFDVPSSLVQPVVLPDAPPALHRYLQTPFAQELICTICRRSSLMCLTKILWDLEDLERKNLRRRRALHTHPIAPTPSS